MYCLAFAHTLPPAWSAKLSTLWTHTDAGFNAERQWNGIITITVELGSNQSWIYITYSMLIVLKTSWLSGLFYSQGSDTMLHCDTTDCHCDCKVEWGTTGNNQLGKKGDILYCHNHWKGFTSDSAFLSKWINKALKQALQKNKQTENKCKGAIETAGASLFFQGKNVVMLLKPCHAVKLCFDFVQNRFTLILIIRMPNGDDKYW